MDITVFYGLEFHTLFIKAIIEKYLSTYLKHHVGIFRDFDWPNCRCSKRFQKRVVLQTRKVENFQLFKSGLSHSFCANHVNNQAVHMIQTFGKCVLEIKENLSC